MTARISKPPKSAMTSGRRNTKRWLLEFIPQDRRSQDPVMGWTSSSDTRRQLKLWFDTLEEAQGYAKRHGLEVMVQAEQARTPRLQAYADNFR